MVHLQWLQALSTMLSHLNLPLACDCIIAALQTRILITITQFLYPKTLNFHIHKSHICDTVQIGHPHSSNTHVLQCKTQMQMS